MSIWSGLGRFFSSSAGALNGSSVNVGTDLAHRTHARELPHRDLCEVLRAFSEVNGTYERLRSLRYGHGSRGSPGFFVDADTPNIHPIRNPCPAILSFFTSKAWPDPLEITTELPPTQATALTAAIEQVWTWSNWSQRRRFVAHSLAELGEVFVKVVASREKQRVWFEVIESAYVHDFESDERDFLTWVRIDVPKCDTDHETGVLRYYTRTEAWDAEAGTYRVWSTDGDAYGRPLDQLGEPLADESGTLAELGIDFLPIVRIPFSDTGSKRGIGAIQIALEAITEGDLIATNHHAVLFQDLEGATVIERDGMDAAGRPLPPVQTAAAPSAFNDFGRAIGAPGRQPDGSVKVGKRSFWSLPGGAHLKFSTPPIDFGASLAALRDHDEYVERLCPSLAYARIAQMNDRDLSGRALRYKLSASIDQATEVRAKLTDGLVRLDQIALTLGALVGLRGFGALGRYEDGDFEHGFVETAILPESALEQAQTALAQGQAAQAMVTAGVPLGFAAKDALALSEDDIAEMLKLATAEADASAERQQAAFGSQGPPDPNQDQGGQQQGQGGQ